MFRLLTQELSMRKFTVLSAVLLLAVAALAWHQMISGKQDNITVALGGFLDPDGK
jgi:hypothetical protein